MSILSILKGLKNTEILAEEDKELLDLAISESGRIKDFVLGFQEYNRPSADKKMAMDVNKSIDSVLLLLKSDFKGRRVSVELNYAKSLPHILAVPDQIKQVFLNILINAAAACPQSGGVITVSTSQEGKRVVVSVKDTGAGISHDNIKNIFQPFYTTKAEDKGTGLGLSISNSIVKNHQGEIRVESEPEKGSTFTILLPVE